jgi:Flp pilus assembly secretin CpaC
MLGAIAAAPAQEGPRPPRPREVLKNAIDAYKRGDYEAATLLFAQAKQGAAELAESEQLDLNTFGTQNQIALRARQDGAANLRQAEAALNQGRPTEAAKLLKAASVNQYLSPGDRQALANLNSRLHSAAPAPQAGDPKALLAAARTALKEGDLAAAESLANQAEKAGGSSTWLHPLADSPAKVRHDIQAALAKTQSPAAAKGATAMVPTKTPGTPPSGASSPFFSPEPAPSDKAPRPLPVSPPPANPVPSGAVATQPPAAVVKDSIEKAVPPPVKSASGQVPAPTKTVVTPEVKPAAKEYVAILPEVDPMALPPELPAVGKEPVGPATPTKEPAVTTPAKEPSVTTPATPTKEPTVTTPAPPLVVKDPLPLPQVKGSAVPVVKSPAKEMVAQAAPAKELVPPAPKTPDLAPPSPYSPPQPMPPPVTMPTTPAPVQPASLSKPAVAQAASPDKKILARQMLAEGYKALLAGDLEVARQMAFRARDLNVELERNELGPDQLLHEVQKRAANAKAPTGPTPADSRGLVKEARALLQKNQLDQAEKLCNQASAVPNVRWGLFEDSPEKLHRDIQAARAVNNRQESVKLLTEARKLYETGQLDQAKKKAWTAQQLHGPYSPFDFGDRPQKLLAEIAKAEAKQPKASTPADIALAQKSATPPAALPAGAGAPKAPATAVAQAARAKAITLVSEARDLERRGLLVEAHQKAQEAKKLGATFAPGEDSPEAVMLTLSAKSRTQIQLTLAQVTDSVSAKPGDPARLQKAQTDLAAARQTALYFGLDTFPVEQKMAWLQQAVAANGGTPSAPPLVQAGYQSNGGGVADAKHQAGVDKLEKSRLELKAGNYTTARRLAEEAFDPAYGVQKQAETVLRDIDAEEHNQRLLAADRTFQAGMEAYLQGQFKHAASILANVDIHLLPPQKQERLREIMSTREMAPTGIVQAGHQEQIKPSAPGSKPGVAVATDQGDDPLEAVRAMEKIQFEQMFQRGLQAQRSALELFKSGQEMKAIEMLQAQLAQVELAQFSPDQGKQLRAPLEKRLQEFRTLQAQKLLDKTRSDVAKANTWDEKKFGDKLAQQQKEVADLIKQCNALRKEGKDKEALAMAYKAHALDPDNVAAEAFIQMMKIRIEQKAENQLQNDNEKFFLDALRIGDGPLPTDDEPIRISKDGKVRLESRSKTPTAIWQENKNPKERAIYYRLDQPISFGFQDQPLGDVIDNLCKLSGVPIYPDTLALQEANVSLDHPLTMDSNGLAMKSALNILLNKMRLTYVVRDESLIITTADKAKSNYKQVVYPIADLIVPVENHPLPEIQDLQAVMQRHLNSQYALLGAYGTASPVTGPYALPPGQPVSMASSGLGSMFGANSQSQPQGPQSYSPIQKRAPGTTMEDLLMDLIKGTVAPHTWKDMGGQGHIQYYPLGMALIVNQTQEVQGDIADLLAALRRLQDMEIAIEMRLVSVSEAFYERIGVDFNVNLSTHVSPGTQAQLLNSSFAPFGQINKNLNVSEKIITGLTPAGTLTPDLGIPIRNSSFLFSVPPFGGYTAPNVDGGLSLGLAFLSDIQVFMLMEAAQGDRRTNIMQAPKLTVFNGQTSTLAVTTNQYVNLGITAIPFNGNLIFQPNNTPLPIGVTLTVTPVVSADRRFVRMNLAPRMTNLIDNLIPLFPIQIPIPNLVDGPGVLSTAVGQPNLFNTFLIQQPNISTITLNTTVNVPDGGTVLMGGLKTMSEGRNEAGPPILSKIPYLSRLFRNVGWGREGQSLMILVTPRIIINEEEERIFLGIDQPIPRP